MQKGLGVIHLEQAEERVLLTNNDNSILIGLCVYDIIKSNSNTDIIQILDVEQIVYIDSGPLLSCAH